MKSPMTRTWRARTIGVLAATGLGLASLGAAPAAADAPVEFSDSVTFTDVNPCSGLPMKVTINNELREHQHPNNFVGHISKTGTTSDGYVMDNGVENFVANRNVVRGAFTDNWRHPDGSKFKAQGMFVFDLTNEELRVDQFTLRCVGG